MPVTALYRLQQPDALGVCRCSGGFPNSAQSFTAHCTDLGLEFVGPDVTVTVVSGTVFGEDPELADAEALALAEELATAALVCSEIPSSVSARTQFISGTLCGLPEYTSPTSPPKKFKRETIGGEQYGCFWNFSGGVCTTPGANGGFAWYFSGSLVFNPLTSCSGANGRLVSSANTDNAGGCGVGAAAAPGVYSGGNAAFFPFGVLASTQSAVLRYWDWAVLAPCQSSSYTAHSGTGTAVLLEEDTEDDVTTRTINPASWVNCVDPSCSGTRELRGAGDFIFDATVMQTKVFWTAEIAGIYRITLNWEDRLLGSSDPFVAVGTDILDLVADATSEDSGWVYAHQGPGREVRLASRKVERIG